MQNSKLLTVFVFNRDNKFLYRLSPVRARLKLNSGEAYARFVDGIFRIVLKTNKVNLKEIIAFNIFMADKEYSIGIDPGLTTGISLFVEDDSFREVLIGINLKHNNMISRHLNSRKIFRHSRSCRKKKEGLFQRSPPPEFETKSEETIWHAKRSEKPKKWLPPSVRARLENTLRWCRVLTKYTNKPIKTMYLEDLYFTPEMSEELKEDIKEFGIEEYNRNKGSGRYNLSYRRSFIHWLYNYKCVYCGYDFIKNDFKVPSEIDHVLAKSNGGNSHLDNLALSCRNCNQNKGGISLETWVLSLKGKQKKRVESFIQYIEKYGLKQHKLAGELLTSSRHFYPMFLSEMLYANMEIDYCNWMNQKQVTEPTVDVVTSSGFDTKVVREQSNLPDKLVDRENYHWVDASCVGGFNRKIIIHSVNNYLSVKRNGYGRRQFVKGSKEGFPRLVKVYEKFNRFGLPKMRVKATKKLSVNKENGEVISEKIGRREYRVCAYRLTKPKRRVPRVLPNGELKIARIDVKKGRSKEIKYDHIGYRVGDFVEVNKDGTTLKGYLEGVRSNGGASLKTPSNSLSLHVRHITKLLNMSNGYIIT